MLSSPNCSHIQSFIVPMVTNPLSFVVQTFIAEEMDVPLIEKNKKLLKKHKRARQQEVNTPLESTVGDFPGETKSATEMEKTWDNQVLPNIKEDRNQGHSSGTLKFTSMWNSAIHDVKIAAENTQLFLNNLLFYFSYMTDHMNFLRNRANGVYSQYLDEVNDEMCPKLKLTDLESVELYCAEMKQFRLDGSAKLDDFLNIIWKPIETIDFLVTNVMPFCTDLRLNSKFKKARAELAHLLQTAVEYCEKNCLYDLFKSGTESQKKQSITRNDQQFYECYINSEGWIQLQNSKSGSKWANFSEIAIKCPIDLIGKPMGLAVSRVWFDYLSDKCSFGPSQIEDSPHAFDIIREYLNGIRRYLIDGLEFVFDLATRIAIVNKQAVNRESDANSEFLKTSLTGESLNLYDQKSINPRDFIDFEDDDGRNSNAFADYLMDSVIDIEGYRASLAKSYEWNEIYKVKTQDTCKQYAHELLDQYKDGDGLKYLLCPTERLIAINAKEVISETKSTMEDRDLNVHTGFVDQLFEDEWMYREIEVGDEDTEAPVLSSNVLETNNMLLGNPEQQNPFGVINIAEEKYIEAFYSTRTPLPFQILEDEQTQTSGSPVSIECIKSILGSDFEPSKTITLVECTKDEMESQFDLKRNRNIDYISCPNDEVEITDCRSSIKAVLDNEVAKVDGDYVVYNEHVLNEVLSKKSLNNWSDSINFGLNGNISLSEPIIESVLQSVYLKDKFVVDLRRYYVTFPIFRIRMTEAIGDDSVLTDLIYCDRNVVNNLYENAKRLFPVESKGKLKNKFLGTYLKNIDCPEPFEIKYILPNWFIWTNCGEIKLGRWDEKRSEWRTDGIIGCSFDKEARCLYFKVYHGGTFTVLRDKLSFLPFASWYMEPNEDHTNEVTVTIKTFAFEIHINVQESLCSIIRLETSEGKDLLSQNVLLKEKCDCFKLRQKLRSFGLNIFSDMDLNEMVSKRAAFPKKNQNLENLLYFQMASVSVATRFASSQWNSLINEEGHFVVKMREACFGEDKCILMTHGRFSYSHICSKGKINANIDYLNQAYVTLMQMVDETFSLKSSSAVHSSSTVFVETVYSLLTLLRPLCFG